MTVFVIIAGTACVQVGVGFLWARASDRAKIRRRLARKA